MWLLSIHCYFFYSTDPYKNIPRVECRVIAIEAFNSVYNNHFTFNKNDIFNVVNRAAEGWLVGEKNGQTGVFPEENIMACLLFYIIDFSYVCYKQHHNNNTVCRLNVLLLVKKRIIFIIKTITWKMQCLKYDTSINFDPNLTWYVYINMVTIFIFWRSLWLFLNQKALFSTFCVKTFNFFKSFVWNTPPGAIFSRYIEVPLVAFSCIFFGRVIVSLIDSPCSFLISFNIFLINYKQYMQKKLLFGSYM